LPEPLSMDKKVKTPGPLNSYYPLTGNFLSEPGRITARAGGGQRSSGRGYSTNHARPLSSFISEQKISILVKLITQERIFNFNLDYTFMKFFQKLMPVIIGLLLMAGSAYAQVQQQPQPQQAQPDSITDTELQKFADVTTEFQKIQKEMTDKVDSMLAEEDMDMQRFEEIMMSKRNPQMADSVEVTEDEQKTMETIQPKLMEMQQESQPKMVSIIQDNELQPQRFQQIMQAVRTNPEVMKRFQNVAAGDANSPSSPN